MRIHLAPGASGNVNWLAPWCAALTASGWPADVVRLPRGTAEAAVPAYRRAVADLPRSIIGGQSFGGRVATLLAAESVPAGVICLSYPLHPPGRQAEWELRTAHWSRVTCPVLLLSGESDPFARIDLLRGAVDRLPNATLITFPRVGHGLSSVREGALGHIAGWIGTAVWLAPEPA
jgi:predicted alpha/beta-hydrolase family hydrolase